MATNPFGDAGAPGNAEAAIDPQRASLLAAVAAHGSAAQDAMANYGKTAATIQQMAIQGAAQNAGAIQAPAALSAQMQGSAQQMGQRYINDASLGAASAGQEQGRLATANGNYMDQIQAAIPIARQVAQQRIQAAQDAHDTQSQTNDLASRKLALEEKQFDAANGTNATAVSPTSVVDAANVLFSGGQNATVKVNGKSDTVRNWMATPEYTDMASSTLADLQAGKSPAQVQANLNSYLAIKGLPHDDPRALIIAHAFGLPSSASDPTSAALSAINQAVQAPQAPTRAGVAGGRYGSAAAAMAHPEWATP